MVQINLMLDFDLVCNLDDHPAWKLELLLQIHLWFLKLKIFHPVYFPQKQHQDLKLMQNQYQLSKVQNYIKHPFQDFF